MKFILDAFQTSQDAGELRRKVSSSERLFDRGFHESTSGAAAAHRDEMDTNTVERVIRPITLTRKNTLFADWDVGARRGAIAMAPVQTAKLDGVEPMMWLTDVLEKPASGQTKQHLHTSNRGSGSDL